MTEDISTKFEEVYPRAGRREDVEKPRPILAVWELTLACDLGCKHCGSRAGKARDDELSTEECLDVVHQLADIGVREVTLIGGEAYLREDWDQIAAEFSKRNVAVGIVTGARGLTQERVDRAEAAGVQAVSISIDGLEDTHDALRGPRGSWRSAVEAAERVAKSSMRLGANTQINRLSMPELPALADLFVDLGVKAWQVQLTVPMGRAVDRPDVLLQPYELLELFPVLVWIKQTKLDPAGLTLFPSNNVGYFGPYERHLRWGAERGDYWTGCAAGKYVLGLEADGKIKGCPSLPSSPYAGGNLKHERLEDVVANAPELTQMGERTVDDMWGWCKQCMYADVCKGGCSWMSHTLFGKTGNNPYCIHRATQLEFGGERERVVRVEAAKGDPFDFGRFEVVREPIETGEAVPSLVGIALDEATSLRTDAGSVWSKEQRRDILKRT